jgi:hypothetical protein
VTDIAPIKGVIELKNDFTSQLNASSIAVKLFGEEGAKSFGAVATAAGLVAGAFAAVGAATIALGLRGSSITDLQSTMDEFTGSAERSALIMEQLRAGTRNTVTDFTLLQNASKVLSANVQLTGSDFRTLSEASFVLADRGLGSVEENLNLVSDALITGRTRALAMKLGVIDNINAEADYAASLGITATQLSDSGKAEARRIEVLRLLGEAAKSSALIEKDFGDRIAEAQVAVKNWVDSVAIAVSESPVLAAGIDAVFTAVQNAFGPNSQGLIDGTVRFIERAAIVAVDFGLAGVETARVMGVAWNVIRTVVLAVETAIVATVDAVIEVATVTAQVGNRLGVVSDSVVLSLENQRTVLRAMTVDLAEQTAEAARAVTGHTEFDETLDRIGGTLFQVRDAMTAASMATREQKEATDAVKVATDEVVNANKNLAESMINRQRLADLEKRSLIEVAKLWEEHALLVIKNSGTSQDFARAQIEATFQKAVASLDALNPKYKEHYDALRAVANESLNSISSNWDAVKDRTRTALRQQLEAAQETYRQMVFSGEFFREDLEKQKQVIDEARLRMRGYGEEAIAAMTAAKEVTNSQTDALREQKKATEELTQAMTFSFEITSQNLGQYLEDLGRFGYKFDTSRIFKLAQEGYSFAEIMQIIGSAGSGPAPPPRGPRIPGFQDGGTVMVGERGPEAVRLPFGSQVFPTGVRPPAAGGPSVHIAPGAFVFNYPVMDNPQARDALGRVVGDVLVKRLRQSGIPVN